MGKHYSAEIRSEVLEKIRGGRKVSSVAKDYGINEMTVRTWLQRDSESSSKETLELSKLRRENEALYRVVGQLFVESDRVNKNRNRGIN